MLDLSYPDAAEIRGQTWSLTHFHGRKFSVMGLWISMKGELFIEFLEG